MKEVNTKRFEKGGKYIQIDLKMEENFSLTRKESKPVSVGAGSSSI